MLNRRRRERQLAWDGCANVRDLGGHRTEDGGMTAFDRVVRADSVRRLSEEGWSQLVDYGIERIVDLRFHDELEADPPATIPVEVVHVPVLPDPASADWHEIGALLDASADSVSAMCAVYLEFLDRYAEGFGQALAAVAGAPPGGVLVHCMAGKDRTGLVSALLLRVAGVSVQDVATDYALTEQNLRPLWQPWFDAARDDRERARRRLMSLTPAATMEGVLGELGARGGEEAYLRDAGVDPSELEAIRARLRA
ncbi:MAG: tyrosine-protein phosphatase [Gaiellaceae bacterium]